jgi:hypothetical protein
MATMLKCLNCEHGFGLDRENRVPIKRLAMYMLTDAKSKHLKLTGPASPVLQLALLCLGRYPSPLLQCGLLLSPTLLHARNTGR